jgi:hypothetical protein
MWIESCWPGGMVKNYWSSSYEVEVRRKRQKLREMRDMFGGIVDSGYHMKECP